MTERELLFRVTKADFDETHIRGSGPGGQNRNKVHTGVRLKHRASGAVGEATDSRSQPRNRIEAFRRLRETPEWERWFREMAVTMSGRKGLGQKIDEAMEPENIRTQIKDDDGRWVDVSLDQLT